MSELYGPWPHDSDEACSFRYAEKRLAQGCKIHVLGQPIPFWQLDAWHPGAGLVRQDSTFSSQTSGFSEELMRRTWNVVPPEEKQE